MKDLIVSRTEDYDQLVEECRGIITEGVFHSRWVLVEAYHDLGKTLRNYKCDSISKLVIQVAEDLEKSARTLWFAIQFYDKYPVLEEAPFGKNVTWRKIVNQYLTGKSDKEMKEYISVRIDRDTKELFISKKYDNFIVKFQ